MLVYLDMCSHQRPLDDKVQFRILVEAEAVLGVIALCGSGHIELASSVALEYEDERNPHPARRAFTREVLGKASRFIPLSPDVERRARAYNGAGLKPLDALHLACAAEAGADYFCTCDD